MGPDREAAELVALLRARRALALVVLALGCGPGVHDLRVGSGPLVVLHGHVDRAQLDRAEPGAPLVAVLVWAGIPTLHGACVKWPRNADLQAGCPDPYGVFYGQPEKAAPVDAAGNFTLELFTLPLAGNTVGDTVTRIAYGTLLVGEDANRDGQLTLGPGAREAPIKGEPKGGPDRGPGDGRGPGAEVLLAASFANLRVPQQRVVFREGGFVNPSNFYPAPQCPEPPQGFSVLAAPPLSDAKGACRSLPADTTIEVAPLPAGDAEAFTCRPALPGLARFGLSSSPASEPREELAPDPALLLLNPPICLSHEVAAVVVPGPCPTLSVWTLAGCWDDAFCAEPDWDHTAQPPSWWPCP